MLRARNTAKANGARQRLPARTFQQSLILSLFFHIFVVAVLLALPAPQPRQMRLPNREIVRRAEKIVWYTISRLPKIAPPAEIAKAPKSQGDRQPKLQSAIVQRGPQPVEQVVITAAPRFLDTVRAPDLVRFGTDFAPAVAPPKAPPKVFVPPATAKAETPAAVRAQQLLVEAVPPTVADPALTVEPPTSLPVSGLQAPSVPVPEPSKPAGVGQPATASVSALVINRTLVPDGPPQVPEPKPGQIARAEETGPPAPRNTREDGGLRVPGVAIEGSNVPKAEPAAADPAGNSGREIVFESSRLGGAQNAISAPLRPSARTVPAHVEQIFKGRNVYTMVVPMRRVAAYSSDWVMWFGERGGANSEGRVRAPLPLVKRARSSPPSANSPDVRVRVLLLLDTEGRIKEVTVLSTTQPTANAQLLADLREWTFRPASRDGVAFEADVILEYSLRLAEAPAP